jgi:ABC-type glycerol-3-phosphate transport system substrate-binding protein
MKIIRPLGGVVAVAALVASSTTPAWASRPELAASTAIPNLSTTIPSTPVTLTLATEDLSGLTQALVKGFEKLHPNVTINIETSSYTDYTAGINLRLASSTPPDLSEAVVLDTSVKDHLLLNLNKYASLYHWSSTVSPYAMDEYRMGANLVAGSGPLWALSSGFALTGLFYNKPLAAKLGIKNPPSTLAQLNTDLAKAKAGGSVGLEVAANDGHAAFLVQQVSDDYEPPAPVNNWIFGVKGSTFNIPGVTKGANALVSWAKAGYLNSSANATALTQAAAAFIAGQALFINDGNWDAALYEKGLGAKVGFAAFPAATPGGRYTAMVGGTAGYEVAAKTKYPDVAAAFLNYSVGPQAAAAVFATGNLPNQASALKPAPGSLIGGVVKAWQQVQKSDGLYGYYAGAFQTANTEFIQTTEELIGGNLTVPAFVSDVQKAWAQAHS